MSENNDNSSDSNSRGDCVLQASRLTNPIRSSVLRPSLFSSNLNSLKSSSTTLAEKIGESSTNARFNPFLKDPNEAEENDTLSEGKDDQKDDDSGKDDNEKPDPLILLAKNGLPKSNLFASVPSFKPRLDSSGFVFGQNVHERVTGENIQSTSAAGEASTSDSEKAESTSSELLFASVIKSSANADSEAPAKETDSRSLDEVAREYEESRAQKRKYEEVETFTGEENEVNIVDISCKLFAFVNSNWEERGRGSLRLNDSKNEDECSRVVFRTCGNLRLLVNTKVWHGMVAERPSQKSLRFTAMDNAGQVKIFLAMSRPDNISTLHKMLRERVDIQQKQHPNSDDNDNERKNGTNERNPNRNIFQPDSGEPQSKKPIPDAEDSH